MCLRLLYHFHLFSLSFTVFFICFYIIPIFPSLFPSLFILSHTPLNLTVTFSHPFSRPTSFSLLRYSSPSQPQPLNKPTNTERNRNLKKTLRFTSFPPKPTQTTTASLTKSRAHSQASSSAARGTPKSSACALEGDI